MYRKELSRLTLVIPTYTRQAYALRNMRYWSGRGAVIHVLDGSPDAIPEGQLTGLGNNIHYHHLPVGINERLSFVLDIIDTGYAALLSDDEFFIPSALVACMEALDAQKDLIACGGRCLTFSPSPYGIVGAAGYISQANYSVDMGDPVERMVYHMHPYTPSTIYAVLRSEAWISILRTMVQKEFPVYAMGELQFELAACYLGKSKVIQNLMWMRSRENPQLTGTSIQLNPETRIWDWWLDADTEQERNDFLEIMSRGLASCPEEVSASREAVIQGIDTYVAYVGASASFLPKKTLMKQIGDIIRRVIPRTLKDIMKKFVFPLHRLQEQDTPLFAAAQALSSTGVVVDIKELANIESLVLEFHHKLKKQQ